MESESVPTKVEETTVSVETVETKPKQKKTRFLLKPWKKLGKIQQVYRLHQKGLSVKEIADKMKISERLVRSYLWRSANPEKYKELLKRYFTKKGKAQQAKKKENA